MVGRQRGDVRRLPVFRNSLVGCREGGPPSLTGKLLQRWGRVVDSRAALGSADVSDPELAGFVADLVGAEPGGVRILDSAAERVPYDLDAITTAGRWWVSGHAATPGGEVTFRLFVKHVQSWARSPLFAAVPHEHRAMAVASVPWRTEPLVYRSDLAERLPAGLRMPRALAVRELDEASAAIWMEAVPAVDHEWTLADYEHAAYLLGRLAASPRVRPLSRLGEDIHRSARTYANGRLAAQILPLLRDEATWRHPLVAGAFDAKLRRRLLAAADASPSYVEELERTPLGTAHGDACPNNILRVAGSPELVLIDFGFWSTQPLGFDLGQLLVGDVQIGRQPASSLSGREVGCLPAYVAGLRAEGCDVAPEVVERAHALHLVLYTGLSALPAELFGRPPEPAHHATADERAATATFILDLLDRTEPIPAAP